MSYHPNLPTLALSSRLSKLVTLPALSTLVQGTELDGVDIDLARRGWLIHAHDLAAPAGCLSPLCAVWAPLGIVHTTRDSDAAGVVKLTDALSFSLWNPLIVLDRPDPMNRQLPIGEFARQVESFRRYAGAEERILVVALRASDLRGTREQLLQLSALRRAAEEWDFWIGLDLLGAIDPRWEAEAAVTRLMPRLRLIRLSDCAMRRSAGVHAYMSGRAVAAAFDCGFTGTLSLAPRAPIWRRAYPAAAFPQVGALSQSLRERFSLIAHIESLPRPTQYHPYL